MTKVCEICNIELQDDYAFQGHIQGKKHLANVQYAASVENSIFVPTRQIRYYRPQAVLEFFSRFGKIVKHEVYAYHIIIEFENKQTVNLLLSKPIYLGNVRLNIQRRNVPDRKKLPKRPNKNVKSKAINDSEDLMYDNIKSIFELESTFDKQLTAFLKRVTIQDSEVEKRYEFTCRKLDFFFRDFYPNCQIHRFGSTVSGLGFKNCDLDIYMDCGFPVSQEIKSNTNPNAVSTAVIFSEVKRILYSRQNLFSKIVPIPKAKTPIIKFTYVPTKVSCDISFKNSLAVHNSQLIKFYLSLHPCLRPTMIILKYWVSNLELHVGYKMTKYALTMMFIFFLQQPNVNLAPPVIELKKRCHPLIIEGWQANFDTTFIHTLDSDNIESISIPKLLHGFFDFYANYNFDANVICPVDGLSYNKAQFNDIQNIPKSMDRYQEYLKSKENPFEFQISRPMCLQDPNELNHNVAGNISAKYLLVLRKYFAAAAEICVTAAGNNYKDLLPSIFSLNIPLEEPNYNVIIYANNFLTVGIPDDVDSRTDITDKAAYITEHWFELISNLIKTYLEKVLKFETRLIHSQHELKQQKIKLESDVHSEDQKKIVMHCSGNYCLWKNRKVNENNILDPSKSCIEVEIDISNKILENSKAENQLKKLKIDFYCYILKIAGPDKPHVIVTLAGDVCAKKVFSDLATFILNNLPLVLRKTLFHMRQYKKSNLNIT